MHGSASSIVNDTLTELLRDEPEPGVPLDVLSERMHRAVWSPTLDGPSHAALEADLEVRRRLGADRFRVSEVQKRLLHAHRRLTATGPDWEPAVRAAGAAAGLAITLAEIIPGRHQPGWVHRLWLISDPLLGTTRVRTGPAPLQLGSLVLAPRIRALSRRAADEPPGGGLVDLVHDHESVTFAHRRGPAARASTISALVGRGPVVSRSLWTTGSGATGSVSRRCRTGLRG